MFLLHHTEIIKSPLNYIGGKTKLLNQILPLFPNEIENFVDLFAGGCNVGINIVYAKKIYFNDNLKYLIEMFEVFKNLDYEDILNHIEQRIKFYDLNIENEDGYKIFRKNYNLRKNPLDLFILTAFSFNHQIRYNNNHEFNNPFGKNRSSFNSNMKKNLKNFIFRLKQIDVEFSSHNFTDFNLDFLTKNDFVYCDPPYLITTGTYNDGKRGFNGWNSEDEKKLLKILERLSEKNIKFALSNVIEHKGNSNDILKDWIKKNNYRIYYLNANYSNSNYQTKKISSTIEVLITNY